MSTSTATIDTLRGSLEGRVIGPADGDYDAAREVFYGGIDKRPAVIARVANDEDIRRVSRSRAIRERRARDPRRRPQHHRHCSSDGGIVLDVRDLNALEIDTDARTAEAGAGLTAVEYTTAAAAEGLATGFGDTGSVGISGITLGGGVGFLVRKHGLTVDNLLGADVVTADGEIVTVDAESHPDLFWAIRGGGGNFGVVSRFRYRLHPVDRIVGGMLFLPATSDVVEGLHGARSQRAGRALDDRERHDRSADAVHPGGVPRLADRDGVPVLRRRRRGRRAGAWRRSGRSRLRWPTWSVR